MSQSRIIGLVELALSLAGRSLQLNRFLQKRVYWSSRLDVPPCTSLPWGHGPSIHTSTRVYTRLSHHACMSPTKCTGPGAQLKCINWVGCGWERGGQQCFSHEEGKMKAWWREVKMRWADKGLTWKFQWGGSHDGQRLISKPNMGRHLNSSLPSPAPQLPSSAEQSNFLFYTSAFSSFSSPSERPSPIVKY